MTLCLSIENSSQYQLTQLIVFRDFHFIKCIHSNSHHMLLFFSLIELFMKNFCFLAANNNIPLRPPPTSSSSSAASSSSNQVTVGLNGSKSTNNGNNVRKDKTTRMRTVLNEKQLLTLRTCYSANPRPDALMKEQLVEMTQLSPRVIRVWFQNKRKKD